MMRMRILLPLFLGAVLLLPSTSRAPDWGFFAHRRINRMAVFTLDIDMMPFFRRHLEYLTEHAVDPDKRRYATRHEAVRHYIDIDQWGRYPFANVPRNWTDALIRYHTLELIAGTDTQRLTVDTILDASLLDGPLLRWVDEAGERTLYDYAGYRAWFVRRVLPQYYEEEWVVDPDTLRRVLPGLPNFSRARIVDRFSEHGILPYHLLTMQNRMTRAFVARDVPAILRLCAEMGHYIGDAHVPLHTTINYNGQLTGQVGIHAFWESRIPELLADTDFDYWVGKAEYIENPREYYWDMVLASHRLVDSVLLVEKRLSQTFPRDRQYCFEDRLNRNIRTQCPEYAQAYAKALNGMVEDRFRAAIRAVGSAWYTAWVDAGQPLLDELSLEDRSDPAAEQLEAEYRAGRIKGREHDG
jgi:hypothetical protein